MRNKILDYLRIGRAQTYPADLFLVLVPFLHGRLDLIQAIVLSVMVWFGHLLSFGQNSLLDSCTITEKGKLPPDFTDPSKQHHPLIKGTVSLHEAKNVILWGLGVATTIFVAFTLLAAENLPFAIASLFLYYVWGSLYNEGLSKESPFGFLSISLCFTFLATWAWFLSHSTVNMLGLFYVAYVFCTILFQIAFSGFVKELEIKERSNLLVKMGAKVNAESGLKRFVPGKSWVFAWLFKGLNLFFGVLLLLENFNTVKLVIFVLLSLAIFHRLHQLTKPRLYIRGKELLSMSIMEILTIYLVPWLMLDPLTVIILEIIGVVYFFGINKCLWATSYPAV
jgi:4-hydroxybenzoate polyprenyltransferase